MQIRVDGPGTVHLSNGTTVEVENDGAPELADLIVVPGSGPGANTGVPAEIARGTLSGRPAEAQLGRSSSPGRPSDQQVSQNVIVGNDRLEH
ncbi:hypothetical protein ACIHFD_66260 [Nonomuraea sp. NPDC051941]|uniref:hypothetical protein n=1 Tax=Nonomuraea sp. NPDC051941 TaxID=3364373 RepID=UPI0037C69E91